MIRIAILNLLLFFAPFAGYALYLLLRTGRIDVEKAVTGRVFLWLIAAGVATVIIGLVAFATYQTGTPAAVYEPARYENGVLIPGGFRDPGKAETEADDGPGS